jgi:hypothetical protein
MLTPDQIAAFRRMYEAGIPPKSQPMFAEICEQAAECAKLEEECATTAKMWAVCGEDRDRWRALAKRLGEALEDSVDGNDSLSGIPQLVAELRAMETGESDAVPTTDR